MQPSSALRGGKKVGLDWEQIQPSNNHRQANADNLRRLEFLRQELEEAERGGKYSKAKRMRRELNKELEVGLYLTHSWCGGCHRYLHLCKCKGD
jgi:hypothetical protein